jgi:aminomethyltransferase
MRKEKLMELKTPLYDSHVEQKGKIVPFGGYLLPVQYEAGVIEEHMAVRTAAGIFDVSHMGELIVSGADALENVQMLVTNDCSKMYDGQIKYSPMCNESGGVVDDLLVYRMAEDNYMLVVNAANRLKDVEWIKNHIFGEVTFTDISDENALIALQGPKSKKILSKLVNEEELPAKYYTFSESVIVGGVPCLVSKTGYTGEDGYEILCSPDDVVKVWNDLLKEGKEDGLIPCGLGARDTLRLEAAMPLYGHEMDEEISPLEAGLSFAVKMKKEDFIGKRGIIDRGEVTRKRIGINITGRGIAREDCSIYIVEETSGEELLVGKTTSGTHCPYLKRPVAMGLISTKYSEVGTRLLVEVRGRKITAEITALPFYKK